jgi:hypothetical protein
MEKQLYIYKGNEEVSPMKNVVRIMILIVCSLLLTALVQAADISNTGLVIVGNSLNKDMSQKEEIISQRFSDLKDEFRKRKASLQIFTYHVNVLKERNFLSRNLGITHKDVLFAGIVRLKKSGKTFVPDKILNSWKKIKDPDSAADEVSAKLQAMLQTAKPPTPAVPAPGAAAGPASLASPLLIAMSGGHLFAARKDVIYDFDRGSASRRDTLKSGSASALASVEDRIFEAVDNTVFVTDGIYTRPFYTFGEGKIKALAANGEKVFAAIGNSILWTDGGSAGNYYTFGEGAISSISAGEGRRIYAAIGNSVFWADGESAGKYYSFGEGNIKLICSRGDRVYALVETSIFFTDGTTGTGIKDLGTLPVDSLGTDGGKVYIGSGRTIYYIEDDQVKQFGTLE